MSFMIKNIVNPEKKLQLQQLFCYGKVYFTNSLSKIFISNKCETLPTFAIT